MNKLLKAHLKILEGKCLIKKIDINDIPEGLETICIDLKKNEHQSPEEIKEDEIKEIEETLLWFEREFLTYKEKESYLNFLKEEVYKHHRTIFVLEEYLKILLEKQGTSND